MKIHCHYAHSHCHFCNRLVQLQAPAGLHKPRHNIEISYIVFWPAYKRISGCECDGLNVTNYYSFFMNACTYWEILSPILKGPYIRIWETKINWNRAAHLHFFIDLFTVPVVTFNTVAHLLSISVVSNRINSVCVYTHHTVYVCTCVYHIN
jgi:hypothetical protein